MTDAALARELADRLDYSCRIQECSDRLPVHQHIEFSVEAALEIIRLLRTGTWGQPAIWTWQTITINHRARER